MALGQVDPRVSLVRTHFIGGATDTEKLSDWPTATQLQGHEQGSPSLHPPVQRSFMGAGDSALGDRQFSIKAGPARP